MKLEEIGKQLTEKIKVASDDVQKLLKLRKRQVLPRINIGNLKSLVFVS